MSFDLAAHQKGGSYLTGRLCAELSGAVQGVGFRPFVYRLAVELDLKGWVANSGQGVSLEVEGELPKVQSFRSRIEIEKPPSCFIHRLESVLREPVGYRTFEIRRSEEGEKSAWVLPDIATCNDCLREVLDPGNRRYLYPFTNCTNCGPRFSIIEGLPYDRARTAMKRFVMCNNCQAEYDDPRDRRFHAQPNACPACGPELELWNASGKVVARKAQALAGMVSAIREGLIVAVKGIGGFHLIVDACNDRAVQCLRSRKRRPERPLPIMVPTLGILRRHCAITALEERMLTSPAAPILLVRRRRGEAGLPELSPRVAPQNPYLGVMLPHAPLQHLFMRELARPVVATSGNLSEEPICIDENEALRRLGGIADFFLVHNRPIVRQLDDSVVRVSAERQLMLRRGRGYAPLQFSVAQELTNLLAFGSHIKNTVAASKGSEIFLSQHIGDLASPKARDVFERELNGLVRLHDHDVQAVVCDLHPDYGSSQAARRYGKRTIAVQHHRAHVFACMAENRLDGPLLGIAWDGTGLGDDGTIWGGEFFYVGKNAADRIAHLRRFPLPGGERAAKEPRRAALGLLHELYGVSLFERAGCFVRRSFADHEIAVFKTMLARRFRVPMASSVGRLFDAVAALLDLATITTFEGQAAMALEYALEGIQTEDSYPVHLAEGRDGPLLLDWSEMILCIIKDRERGVPVGNIAAKFHNALVEGMVAVAKKVGEEQVVLSGGCFQNRYLTERAVTRLRAVGFQPYWHQNIPPNDGGIAVGQLVAAARGLGRRS